MCYGRCAFVRKVITQLSSIHLFFVSRSTIPKHRYNGSESGTTNCRNRTLFSPVIFYENEMLKNVDLTAVGNRVQLLIPGSIVNVARTRKRTVRTPQNTKLVSSSLLANIIWAITFDTFGGFPNITLMLRTFLVLLKWISCSLKTFITNNFGLTHTVFSFRFSRRRVVQSKVVIFDLFIGYFFQLIVAALLDTNSYFYSGLRVYKRVSPFARKTNDYWRLEVNAL